MMEFNGRLGRLAKCLQLLELDATLLAGCRSEAKKTYESDTRTEMVSSWAAKYSFLASSSS